VHRWVDGNVDVPLRGLDAGDGRNVRLAEARRRDHSPGTVAPTRRVGDHELIAAVAFDRWAGDSTTRVSYRIFSAWVVAKSFK
jgi:hypothetical protein